MSKDAVRVRDTVLRYEFEYRIFVSFGMVLLVAFIALGPFSYLPSPADWVIGFIGVRRDAVGYFIAAAFMIAASFLRIWAGSTLSSFRMMSFKVRTDVLLTAPPYTLCRNPIYLADFTAFCGFAAVLPAVAISLPILLLLHYKRLITYEEKELSRRFARDYAAFSHNTPPFFPTLKSVFATISSGFSPRFNKDGIRHNSLYLLFIPGFVVAAITHNFYHALAIGLPAVFDWAIIHTVVGTGGHRSTTNTGN